MVNFCAVVGCGKRGDRDKGTIFFRLPTVIKHQGEQTRLLSERRRREWLAAIRRQDIKPGNYPYTRVCSEHFVSGQPSKLYESTHPDWAPSRNLGHDEKRAKASGGMRYARAVERAVKRSRIEDDQDEHFDICESESDTEHNVNDLESGTAVQTSLTQEEVNSMEKKLVQLEGEKNYLEGQLAMLKQEIQEKKLDEEAFRDNDAKVSYYTGLPTWPILRILMVFLQSGLLSQSSLTPFQQLVMTLM